VAKEESSVSFVSMGWWPALGAGVEHRDLGITTSARGTISGTAPAASRAAAAAPAVPQNLYRVTPEDGGGMAKDAWLMSWLLR
jgi:hypothetical protein